MKAVNQLRRRLPTLAERTGREHPADSSGKHEFPVQGGAESGAVDVRESLQAPDLLAVVQAWPMLPASTRAAILAMILAAGKKPA
jgi:hypothetical protein